MPKTKITGYTYKSWLQDDIENSNKRHLDHDGSYYKKVDICLSQNKKTFKKGNPVKVTVTIESEEI